LIGLALSGGGIRSAATNIGVLQGLSEKDVLPKLDYLSTVSGGGYIGACLSSLLSNRYREPQDCASDL
jgi:predicted acylesterase/phospholipase RssA